MIHRRRGETAPIEFLAPAIPRCHPANAQTCNPPCATALLHLSPSDNKGHGSRQQSACPLAVPQGVGAARRLEWSGRMEGVSPDTPRSGVHPAPLPPPGVPFSSGFHDHWAPDRSVEQRFSVIPFAAQSDGLRPENGYAPINRQPPCRPDGSGAG